MAGCRARRSGRAAARAARPPRGRVLRRRSAVVLHPLRPRLAVGGSARASGRRRDRSIHSSSPRPAAGYEGRSRHRRAAGQDPARAAQRAPRAAGRGRACCRRCTTAPSTRPRCGCACSRMPSMPGCRKARCGRCCPRCARALAWITDFGGGSGHGFLDYVDEIRARARQPGLEGLRRLDPVAGRHAGARLRSRCARCRATPTRRRRAAPDCSTRSTRTAATALREWAAGAARAVPVGVLGRDPRRSLPGDRARRATSARSTR